MVIDGGGGSKVFPVSVPKGLTNFTNVHPEMVTLVHVDDTSFVGDTAPILGGYKYILNCVVTFEVDLDPCLNTYIYETFNIFS